MARLISEDLLQGKLLKFEAGSPKMATKREFNRRHFVAFCGEFDTPKKSEILRSACVSFFMLS